MTVVPPTFAPGHPDYIGLSPRIGSPRDSALRRRRRKSRRQVRHRTRAGRRARRLSARATWMNIALLRQPIQSVQAQWLVLGIFEDDAEPPRGLARDGAGTRSSRGLIGEKDLTGSLGELTALYDVPGSKPARSSWSDWVRGAFRAGRGVFGGLCPGQAAGGQAPRVAWRSFCPF